MMTGIFTLITALPELFKILNRLGDVVGRFMEWQKQNNLNEWITDLEGTIDQLEKAKTSEEKFSAGKSLVDLIHGIK